MITTKYKFLSFATIPPGNVRNLFLAGLTGVLLVFAFPKPDLGLVAFVALVPLLISIRQARWREAAGLGFICGKPLLDHAHCCAVWKPSLGSCARDSAPYCRLSRNLFCGIRNWRGVSWPKRCRLCSTHGWFVTFEFLRSHLLIGFPWNLLGHSQYQNLPLIQIADATGVYGISFVVAAVNAVIADALAGHFRWRKTASSLATVGLSVSGAFIYGWMVQPRIPRPVIRVALLQGNISQDI